MGKRVLVQTQYLFRTYERTWGVFIEVAVPNKILTSSASKLKDIISVLNFKNFTILYNIESHFERLDLKDIVNIMSSRKRISQRESLHDEELCWNFNIRHKFSAYLRQSTCERDS